MQDDFSRQRPVIRELIRVRNLSNFYNSLPLVHGTTSWAFSQIVIREILENVVTNPTNHEVFTAAILSSLPENLGGKPSEEEGAHDNYQINGNHPIQCDSKHISLMFLKVEALQIWQQSR